MAKELVVQSGILTVAQQLSSAADLR